MKRYFLVHASDMPKAGAQMGHWHHIDVGSHGPAGVDHHIVVLLDTHIDAPPAWRQMPRVTDAKTPISDRVPHHLLGDLGVRGEHTTAEVVDVLERVHPMFRH